MFFYPFTLRKLCRPLYNLWEQIRCVLCGGVVEESRGRHQVFHFAPDHLEMTISVCLHFIKHNMPRGLKTKIASCLKYKCLPEREKCQSFVGFIYIHKREFLHVNRTDSNWREKPRNSSERGHLDGRIGAWEGLALVWKAMGASLFLESGYFVVKGGPGQLPFQSIHTRFSKLQCPVNAYTEHVRAFNFIITV